MHSDANGAVGPHVVTAANLRVRLGNACNDVRPLVLHEAVEYEAASALAVVLGAVRRRFLVALTVAPHLGITRWLANAARRKERIKQGRGEHGERSARTHHATYTMFAVTGAP